MGLASVATVLRPPPGLDLLALPENLLDRLAPCPTSGCWLWFGWDNGKGYGKVSVDGRAVMVYRRVWELLVGPLPPELVLDHLCRIPSCVNPYHLEPVTVAVNTHRGNAVLFKRT